MELKQNKQKKQTNKAPTQSKQKNKVYTPLKQKKQTEKIYIPNNNNKNTLPCIHDYIKNDGIITCNKCDTKAISYLTPLLYIK
jgi:hypothetical protein